MFFPAQVCFNDLQTRLTIGVLPRSQSLLDLKYCVEQIRDMKLNTPEHYARALKLQIDAMGRLTDADLDALKSGDGVAFRNCELLTRSLRKMIR